MVHPQYYGVQTPWGIYPANIVQQPQGQQTPQGGVQQQQQQLLRGQQGRPLTPSQQQQQQQQDALGTPTNGIQAQAIQAPGGAGYQIIAPAYYDQNGQLVMGNARGIGTPVRLVSPAPVLVNTGQQGKQLAFLQLGLHTFKGYWYSFRKYLIMLLIWSPQPLSSSTLDSKINKTTLAFLQLRVGYF